MKIISRKMSFSRLEVVKETTVKQTAEIIIRRASPEDASVAAELMYEASRGYVHIIFGQPESRAKGLAISAFAEVFPVPGHIQSYSHTFVAESDSGVAGIFLGFDKKTRAAAIRNSYKLIFSWLKRVRLLNIPRLIRFAIGMGTAFVPVSGEDYYIEYFAVLPERHLQGIGRSLMQAAELQARQKGLKRLALDVAIENEGAQCFYERLGFQGAKTVADKRHTRYGLKGEIRMVKYI